MYKKVNEIFRTALNNAGLSYRGNVMPIHFSGDYADDKGAHIRTLLFTNTPDYKEVGSFVTNTSREITGYYQVGFFLPNTDSGFDCSLTDLADQLDLLFRRQTFVDVIKMEYLSMSREDILRVDGHYSITCRINFRTIDCVAV